MTRYIPGLNSRPTVERVVPQTIHQVEGETIDRDILLSFSLNVKRAKTLGYRSIGGMMIYRAKVRKGMMRKGLINKKRKPRGMGMKKKSLNVSMISMAERKVQRKCPNLEVFNSYWVAQSGKHNWYEVIMIDPYNPHVVARSQFDHFRNQGRRRVFRGLTTAGRKSRVL